MITQTELTVRPALSTDRNSLANIFHFEPFVHRHLDWRPPLDWLGHEPYLIMEKGDRLQAALACPPDPPGVAWVRVFACQSRLPVENAWDPLWLSTVEWLRQSDVKASAAIPLKNWFKTLLIHHGFTLEHNVVVLAWENDTADVSPAAAPVEIRRMEAEDLEQVHQVDQQAFAFLWRNSLESLRLAHKQAVYATVATDGADILAYQISTPSPLGAHLARLAVLPSAQRQGIGYALVRELQQRFIGLRPSRLSVNTQDVNTNSIALYEKAGFIFTSETYPVYLFNLD